MFRNGDWQLLPIVTQMACSDINIPGMAFFFFFNFMYLQREADVSFCVFNLGEMNLVINWM